MKQKVKHLPKKEKLEIADFACGTANVGLLFAEKGNSVDLIDNEKKFFEPDKFNAYIADLFENVCRNVKGTGLLPFQLYLKSDLTQNYFRKSKILFILLIKNVL